MKRFALMLMLSCMFSLLHRNVFADGYVSCPSNPNDISLHEPEPLPITFNGTTFHNVYSYMSGIYMESIYFVDTATASISGNTISFTNAHVVWAERLPNGNFYSCFEYGVGNTYSSINGSGVIGWKYYTNDGNASNPDGSLHQLTLPYPYNGLTYTQKVIGFDFDDPYAGYERELYSPADSGIRIYHTSPDSNGDFLATGMFTGNASETISAHNGVLENQPFHDHIRLNEKLNCFVPIKSNVDIRWTTNYGQYVDFDNCGSYHEDGDLVVAKNLNADGTEPVNNCIHPASCAFPDFTNVSANIRDMDRASDYVHIMDVFKGVPSYLNAKNGDGIDKSYYQCTEYVARYLHSRSTTDYTYNKYNSGVTQGFDGPDFHPHYGGVPAVDKTVNGVEHTISLTPVSPPQAGDVAMFSWGHAAVVKETNGTTATLIEQNYTANGRYSINRTVAISDPDITFFRYPAVIAEETNTVSSTIQDAYDSVTASDQTIKMQCQIFREDLNFSNDVVITLLGGYNPGFQTVTGFTTIYGSLTISSGTVIADYLCIQ